MQLSSYYRVRKINEYLGIDMIIKHQLHLFPDRVDGLGFTSARLCPVEGLPSGLHAHGAPATIWAPIRSSPSFPQASATICANGSVDCRVKLAVICSARSALRRWSCSNCERRCQRIHCVRKYNGRFNIHVQGKTNFMFPTFQTRRDNRDGSHPRGGRQQSSTQVVPNEVKPETW